MLVWIVGIGMVSGTFFVVCSHIVVKYTLSMFAISWGSVNIVLL